MKREDLGKALQLLEASRLISSTCWFIDFESLRNRKIACRDHLYGGKWFLAQVITFFLKLFFQGFLGPFCAMITHFKLISKQASHTPLSDHSGS